jgi:hypothetical protein
VPVAQLYLHTQVLQPFLLKCHPCPVLLMVLAFIRVLTEYAPQLHGTEVLHAATTGFKFELLHSQC